MSQFEGTTLLPELTEDEKKDLIPQRRFTVSKADGEIVSDQTFEVSQRSATYRPVELGDVLIISLYNIDQSGNQGTNPRVEEVTVSDLEGPTAQPGAFSHVFKPIVEEAVPVPVE